MVQLLTIFGFVIVLLRAAILCCQTIAVGGILFFLIVARDAGLRTERVLNSAWKLIRWAALGFVLSEFLYALTNSLVLTATTDLTAADVIGANYVIASAIGIVAGLMLLFWPASLRRKLSLLALLPCLLMLTATVMTSHSFSRVEGRALLVTFSALHYLTTASWIGGLPFLLLSMKRLEDSTAKTTVMQRFSRLAQISVAVLFLAGLGMSWVYVGSLDAIYGTAYGVMVSTKLALFACLLLLGAANFYIAKNVGDSGSGARSLVRFGEAEIGIGLTVVLAAASLTSQPPGADLTQDRVTLHEIVLRFAPRMPRLSSPDVKELSIPTRQLYKEAESTGVSLPPAFVPGQSAWHPDKLADLYWSEYNHNWAGLIVFIMGVLALLSRSKYFPWAKIWPLSFLGLAVFLFLRADPENWPLGPNGFWESFSEADVLQHRAAVVLIVVFAIFQYLVETGRLKSHAAALVFPAVCAIGGVVLLTHTHAISNIKEEMLAELSHTPLAIFGLIAGWARWLELRLPEDNPARKYLSWVWPVSFMIVGLILMDYHETNLA